MFVVFCIRVWPFLCVLLLLLMVVDFRFYSSKGLRIRRVSKWYLLMTEFERDAVTLCVTGC